MILIAAIVDGLIFDWWWKLEGKQKGVTLTFRTMLVWMGMAIAFSYFTGVSF